MSQGTMRTYILAVSVLAIALASAALRAAAQAEAIGKQAPAVTHNTWTSGAAMPKAVVGASAGVVQVLIPSKNSKLANFSTDEIIVVGGQNTHGATIAAVQVYSPEANTWSAGASYPTRIQEASVAVAKNVLYVFGGYNGETATNAVWAYSSRANVWIAMADMPTARYDTTVVVEKNIIYVIGGVDNNGDFVDTVESYDHTTNTWTEEAPMLLTKASPAAALVGTTIVAADGEVQPGQITGDAEGYDAATNTWTELTADPTPRVFSCSGSVGAKLFDAGGYLNNAGAAATVNESFRLSKNKWTTTLAPMPQGTMRGASVVYRSQLYCIGGWATWEGSPINNVQIYRP